MQARELTPQEVAEGSRNITDTNYSATQVQALVRKMDASKKKYQNLKRSGQRAAYEEAVKKENEIIYAISFHALCSLIKNHAQQLALHTHSKIAVNLSSTHLSTF